MYEDRINSAISILQTHNEAIGKNDKGEPNLGYVNPDEFIGCIKLSGGTNEDRLKSLSYEDILECLPAPKLANGKTIPQVALAKDLAKAFRGKEEIATKRPIHSRKAETMTLEELVAAFDPEEYASPIAKRLSDIAKENPFIVFSSGRLVDVETTLKLIKEIKAGYPAVATVVSNNQVKQVYKIGELPDALADENPIYHNRPLRPDGSCDQTGRSWDGIPLQVKQLIYLAVKSGELAVNVPNGIKVANDVIDMALAENAFEKMSVLYKKASLNFFKAQTVLSLPTLKIPLKLNNSSGSSLNQGKKVEFLNRK